MKTLKSILFGISIAYMIVIGITLIALLIGGCTPQKRLDRLVRKHPYLSRVDTVTVTDTFQVMVPGIRSDTNFQKATFLSAIRDTMLLQKEQLTVKIYEYRDSVFIEAQCDTVYKTVVREIKVPYKTVTANVKEKIHWSFVLGFSLLYALLIALYIFYRFR